MAPKVRAKRRRLAALALRDEWDPELWEDDRPWRRRNPARAAGDR
jgi:hypothetical protein